MNDKIIIIGIVALIAFLIFAMVKSEEAFEAKMVKEYADCIAAKETEYTCKSYIQSMRAQRSADNASKMAAVGVGMAIGNMGARR